MVCNAVVRNLPIDQRKKKDPPTICRLVNRVIRDGLKLTDVREARAESKQRSDNKPGLVLVYSEPGDQKRKLFQYKRNLGENKDFANVCFDSAMSQDELISRFNMQTMITEIGKGKNLRFHGKRLAARR